MADFVGRTLGNYRIVELIGKGGMAAVYRAQQLNIERDVAIKIIKSDLASSEEFVRRFQREAQTIANLSHPHILKLFDYGQFEDTLYLVMELMTGGSLAGLIQRQPLDVLTASEMLDQIASALDFAHRRGIIHRDLKPQNILLDTDYHCMLTDFGIAKLLHESTVLTHTGATMGTPAYMAPEQWQDAGLDARTDVYALGVTLFEMLTGRLPFNGDTPAHMMFKHLQEPPAALRDFRPELPNTIEPIIAKALAKQPNERYATPGQLAAAFKVALGTTPAVNVSEGEPTLVDQQPTPVVASTDHAEPPKRGSRPRWLIPVAALVVLGVVAGGIALFNNGAPSTTVTSTPLVAFAPSATIATSIPTVTAGPTLSPTTPPTVTSTTTATLTPTATATLDLVQAVASMDAQATAAARLTAIAGSTQAADHATATATRWTKTPTATLTFTPNVTASIESFVTQRANTATAQYQLGLTSTATQWTKTPTPTLAFTPSPTPFSTVSANNQWKPQTRLFGDVEMVLVPPGCFMMGRDNGDSNEKPVHQVCITKPFWLGKTEVTNKQYGARGYFDGDNRPRESITAADASRYCSARGERLPTEAEWEYAARGPDNLILPWGNIWDAGKAVGNRGSSDGTANVGSIPAAASWVGTLDMIGNVREWVFDWYDENYYSSSPKNDPEGPASGGYRVLRGGSWADTSSSLQATSRRYDLPGGVSPSAGFRCARAYDDQAVLTVPTAAPKAAVGSGSGSGAGGAPAPVTVTANNQWKPQEHVFDGVTMVLVPPGCYMMGSNLGDAHERPINKQCFDKPFWIDKYEVTNKQFKDLGGQGRMSFSPTDEQQPRVEIRWGEAAAFCEMRGAHLPTEVEWEYAARGPDSLEYPWGNNFVADNAVFAQNSGGKTAPVGSKAGGKSWVGAYDLSGNVWEWTSSLYRPYPYNSSDGRENRTDANLRSLRGGSWSLAAFDLRAAARNVVYPTSGMSGDGGFRCARSYDGSTALTAPTAAPVVAATGIAPA